MFVIIAIVLIVAICFRHFFIEFEDNEEVHNYNKNESLMVEKADLSKIMIQVGCGTMKKRNGSPRATIINESINALSSRTFLNRCCR